MTSIRTSDIEDITYLAGKYTGLYFFSNSASPNPTDTVTTGIDGAKNLLYELTDITKTISGSELIISYSLPVDLAFPASKVNGIATANTLPLDSASAFIVRDRIIIENSGNFQQAEVTGISSNTLTVKSYPNGGDLPVIPADNTDVRVVCCQVAIKKDSSAGISDIFTDKGFSKIAGITTTDTITIPIRRT